MRLAHFLLAAALSAGVVIACSSERRLPNVSDPQGASGAGGAGGGAGSAGAQSDGGVDLGPFNPDATCGYHVIEARSEPARLYFVLDRSGSMTDPVGNSGGKNKYDVVRSAVVGLVQRIGWRSEIGAAVFPSSKGGGPCAPGYEVLPMQRGDDKSFFDQGQQGPVTAKLAQALNVTPQGGTPTGKTLAKLAPKLSALGKNSYVILATDGGPNCNDQVSCESKDCIPNIEGLDGCKAAVNCCDPGVDPSFSSANCLDADTTLSAVLGLAQAGVKTLVVGIPGSAAYSSLLDLLAVAGGAPRAGDTRYYRVDNLNELEALLLTIGSQVTVSCDVTLAAQPEDPELVNLFFDEELVFFDAQNGWSWTGSDRLTLHGKACDDLLAGAVGALRIIVGCPTQIVN